MIAIPSTQPSLFSPLVTLQLTPPWWACLGGGLASAGVAEAEREEKRDAQRQRKEARRARIAARLAESRQQALDAEVDPEIPLPTDGSICDGPGICPLIRCKWNLLIDIKRTTPDQPHLAVETITVGGQGGTGTGVSLAAKRSAKGHVRMEDLDAIVDAVVAKADRLPATCMWDYVRTADLIPSRFSGPEEGDPLVDFPMRPHMTLEQIAEIRGTTREAVRTMLAKAYARLKANPETIELAPDFVPTPDFVPAKRLVRR